MTNANEKNLKLQIRKAKPVSVRSHRYGTIRVRQLTLHDMVFVEELIKGSFSARDFTVKLIQHQVTAPTEVSQTVGDWKDRLLLRVATAWVKHEKLARDATPQIATYDEFRQTIVDYVAEQHRQMQAAIESVQKSYRETIEPAISTATSNLSRISNLMAGRLDAIYRDSLMFSHQLESPLGLAGASEIGKALAHVATDRFKMKELESTMAHFRADIVSPWVEEAKQARQSMLEVMASLTPQFKFTQEMDLLSQSAGKQLLRMDTFENSAAIASQVAEAANWAKISQITLLAETSLLKVQPPNVASLLQVEQQIRDSVRGAFAEFSSSFADLYRPHAQVGGNPVTSLTLFRLPPVEYFAGAQLVESISVEESIRDITPQQQQTKGEIAGETEESLPALLANLDPALVQLWRGAKQALRSDNPDRIRHFAISLRELTTQVLHRLAPDDQIRAWSNSANHFYQNRPTRRARLEFICRRITNGKFGTFVEKDISASLELLDLFQTGTHGVIVEYTPAQLDAMTLKMDALMRFILEISTAVYS